MRTSYKASAADDFRSRMPWVPSDGPREDGLPSSARWTSLLSTRANMLVTGAAEALDAFVRAARPAMREPVRWAADSTALRAEPAPTLILSEVNALDDAGQQWLMQWLNEPHDEHTQIISLTWVPLFPLVETKRFDASLYYRLNTIHLKI